MADVPEADEAVWEGGEEDGQDEQNAVPRGTYAETD